MQRMTDRIRELKREGYAIHVTEQALTEMVKQIEDDPNHAFTMHNKELKMASSDPECNIGTDNLWIENGQVKLCPYHPPIGDFLTEPRPTLKQMWEGEKTMKIRAQTRACRRLCTISCLRRTPLMHKISTFLKIA